jgi:Family of unknown function (DUF6174)
MSTRILVGLLFLGTTTQVVAAESITLQQLDSAETVWKRQAPPSYAFSAEYNAMVLPRGCSRKFHFEVHKSHVVPASTCRMLRSFSSVPMLFRAIREGLSQANTDVSATFNIDLGYPTDFTVGDSNMADAYFHLRIFDFQVLDKPYAPN